MPRYNAPFEIHVHGEVPLRADVGFDQLQEALKPLWTYAGAKSLADGAASAYEEEPGIRFDANDHILQICWTVKGEDDFRQALDEMCMALNDLTSAGAALEVTFYDAEFDEEDEQQGRDSRDDFVMLFVGPTPAAIMQVQRDLLVQDLVNLMERHFEASELADVVTEVDKLFSKRFESLVTSLEISKPPKGQGGGGVFDAWQVQRHHQLSLTVDRVVGNDQDIVPVKGNGLVSGGAGIAGKYSLELHGV